MAFGTGLQYEVLAPNKKCPSTDLKTLLAKKERTDGEQILAPTVWDTSRKPGLGIDLRVRHHQARIEQGKKKPRAKESKKNLLLGASKTAQLLNAIATEPQKTTW